MVSLTDNERKALLVLFKEYDSYYNANSLSKKLGISHVGAQKMLKRLQKENLTISRTVGKSIIYRPNLSDEYAQELISFLLADEANNFKRWKDEFKQLYKKGRIVMMYGSAITNYQKANDIDIMVVIRKNEFAEVKKILAEKGEILPKKIHAIKLTENELLKNIKSKKKAIIDIVKNAIILYGQDSYVGVVKHVTSL